MRYLYQERGYYYFRSRIPNDLQEYFGCSMVKKSLGTKDFKTAVVSVKLLSHEFFRVIEIMRTGILSKKQMESFVREFFHEHLKSREYSSLVRNDVRDEAYRRKRIQECDTLLEQYNYHLHEKRDHYDDILTDFLKSHDITLEKNSYEFLKLRQNFIVALIQATEVFVRADAQAFSPTSLKSNVVESPFSSVRLRTDAAKRFRKVQNATAMIWKLLQVAEKSFRSLKAAELLPDVYAGKVFVDGIIKNDTKVLKRIAA